MLIFSNFTLNYKYFNKKVNSATSQWNHSKFSRKIAPAVTEQVSLLNLSIKVKMAKNLGGPKKIKATIRIPMRPAISATQMVVIIPARARNI